MSPLNEEDLEGLPDYVQEELRQRMRDTAGDQPTAPSIIEEMMRREFERDIARQMATHDREHRSMPLPDEEPLPTEFTTLREQLEGVGLVNPQIPVGEIGRSHSSQEFLEAQRRANWQARFGTEVPTDAVTMDVHTAEAYARDPRGLTVLEFLEEQRRLRRESLRRHEQADGGDTRRVYIDDPLLGRVPVGNPFRSMGPQPLSVGKAAEQPYPRELLGAVKNYLKVLVDVDRLNENHRKYMKLKRAANVLQAEGMFVGTVPFPAYFDNIDEDRLNKNRVAGEISTALHERFPDYRFHVDWYGNLIHIIKPNKKVFVPSLVAKYAEKYCQAIAERDSTFTYEIKLSPDANVMTLRMTAAARNLFDRDETGDLVHAGSYPWLNDIIHQGMRLPMVVAEFEIKQNRMFSPQNLYYPQFTVPDDILINRHLAQNRCFGSVTEAITDKSKIRESVARGYSALISMNLFEHVSFPRFENRYYQFYNTVTGEIERIDIYAYQCARCMDLESCKEGGRHGCDIYQNCGCSPAISDSANTCGDTGEDSVPS